MENIKKVLKKETLFTVLFVIIALHPFIELDYLLSDYINIPRLTTIIDYLVLPLLVLLICLLYERDKKRIAILLIYIGIFGVYFLIHCLSAIKIQTSIHLTDNFVFSINGCKAIITKRTVNKVSFFNTFFMFSIYLIILAYKLPLIKGKIK